MRLKIFPEDKPEGSMVMAWLAAQMASIQSREGCKCVPLKTKVCLSPQGQQPRPAGQPCKSAPKPQHCLRSNIDRNAIGNAMTSWASRPALQKRKTPSQCLIASPSMALAYERKSTIKRLNLVSGERSSLTRPVYRAASQTFTSLSATGSSSRQMTD